MGAKLALKFSGCRESEFHILEQGRAEKGPLFRDVPVILPLGQRGMFSTLAVNGMASRRAGGQIKTLVGVYRS